MTNTEKAHALFSTLTGGGAPMSQIAILVRWLLVLDGPERAEVLAAVDSFVPPAAQLPPQLAQLGRQAPAPGQSAKERLAEARELLAQLRPPPAPPDPNAPEAILKRLLLAQLGGDGSDPEAMKRRLLEQALRSDGARVGT